MTLDHRGFAVLVACVTHGSFGRAAAALNMTQPAVTRMVRRMETQLGVPLFERGSTGVIPTIYARGLLPYADTVVAEIGNAIDLLQELKGASRGTVRIGGVASATNGLVVEAVARVRAHAPSLQYLIVEEIEDKLIAELKAGTIDLVVSPGPIVDDEITLACEESVADEVQVFARPDHPVFGRGPVTLETVNAHDWALPPSDTPVTREWRRRFHVAGLEPRPPCVSSRSVKTLIRLAALTDLLCWMPIQLVAAETDRGSLLPADVPDLSWHRMFRIYRRRRGVLAPAAVQFLEQVRQIAA
ncbi:LysR family transcriptional regulator [Amorphus sp. 3PC139-8]|uniref:LysR family transcriptional regulator n=1 Tax=Amorphus sp. 3PC139-8 TaxID=2735676 RepID=UPI00345D0F9C